jgi:hypothetical protein
VKTLSTAVEAAYRDSLEADVATMASELQEILGQRVVAFVTGSKSNKTVGRWARGETEDPGDAALGRLRALYRIMLLMRGRVAPPTIRAWMTSPNPDLGEEVPAAVLREGEPQRVLNAARHFIDE